MASKAGQPEPEKVDIEEALDTIDKTLDRTKVLYEQYFLGMQKQPPSQIHMDVERRLRDLQQMSIRNTGLRYRFATLQQKFGSYNSYWRRTLKQIENGTYIRNLQKISRKAAQTGEEIPEEILAAMPKRMREQVKRDREQAIAIAKRRSDTHSEDDFADEPGDAMIGEAPEVVRQIPRGGTHALDASDGDLDFEAFFASVDKADDTQESAPAYVEKPAAPAPAPRSAAPAVRPSQPVVQYDLSLEDDEATTFEPPSGPPPRATGPVPVQQSRGTGSIPSGPQQPRAATPPPVASGPQQPRATTPPAEASGPQQPRAATPPPVASGPQHSRGVTQPGAGAAPRAGTPPPVPPSRSTGPVPSIPGQGPERATGPIAAIPGQPPQRASGPIAIPGQPPQRATGPIAAIPGQPPQRASGPIPTGAIPTQRNTGAIPTQRNTGAIPTQTGAIPTQTGAIPTQTGAIPTQTGAIPTQTGAIPTHRNTGPIPTQTGVVPTQRKTGPMAAVPAPAGSGVERARTGPVPIVPGPSGAPAPQMTRPSGPIPTMPNLPRGIPNVPRPGGAPAPSQVSKPNPITPGSSTARPAVPVETMSGPFPRAAAPPPVNVRQEVPKVAAPPRPQAAPPRPPPGMNDADVNALYATYVKAKQAVGEEAGPGAYGKLLQTINAQAPKIMEQYKAKGVEFSVVVKDNQVVIKAKPKT